jgi:addiction module HigA family antidote
MGNMHDPPHPGEVLRDGVFNGTGITVTAFANRIGVTRAALSRILNRKIGITAETAVRLEAALGTSAESWLHMQANYDLWRARKSLGAKVAKIAPISDKAA